MTKAQWKAVLDFCRENCISKNELLFELKQNGTVDRNARIEDLAGYTDGTSYNEMMRFLEKNV